MKIPFLMFAVLFSFNVLAENYVVGQVWEYKNRFLEGKSTLTILKIEKYSDLGDVIHVRIDDINMINPLKGNEINEIPHLPFKKVGIDSSVTKLIRIKKEIPDYLEGYNTWKEAYDAGKAGAFETSVKDTLRAMLGAEWVEK